MVKPFIIPVLLWLAVGLILGAEHAHCQTNRISVSGSVYQNEVLDSGLTDYLLSELSRHSQFNVVERASLGLILNEQILQNIRGDVLKQVGFGRLIKADCLVWVSLYQTNGLIEVVKTSTGRGMASWPFQYDRQTALAALTSQIPRMVDAICQKMTKPTAKSMTVAFVKPAWDAGNERWRSSIDQMIAGLSSGLETNGIGILARQFSQDLIKEQWAYEKGLVLSDIAGGGLEGADCLIRINLDQDTQTLVVSLIEITTGRRIGQTTFPLSDYKAEITSKQILEWLIARLRVMTDRRLAVQVVPKKPRPIIELLPRFYQGILLHNEGRYIDALEYFIDINAKTSLIPEIDDWIVSCFRLAGITEVADHWLEHPSTNKPSDIGQTVAEQQADSIAYLGITCECDQWSREKNSLNLLAMEALEKTGQRKVMSSGDISALRDEYDLLVGLEQTRGTTWQNAPDMLFNDAITVHITGQSGSPMVRMCRVQERNPNMITEVHLPLPANINQWKETLSKGMRELVNAEQKTKTWTPPSPVVGYSFDDLLRVMTTNNTDWNHIRAIILDPSQTISMIYNRENPLYKSKRKWTGYQSSQLLWDHGLDIMRWILRILPNDHHERPLIEFMEASYENPPVYTRWYLQNPIYKLEIFMRVAEKYPAHPLGLLSRYNYLVMTLTPSNMAAIQPKISDVVKRLDQINSPDIDYKTMKIIHNVDRALQYTLGKTKQMPPDVFPRFNHIEIRAGFSGGYITTSWPSEPIGYQELAPQTQQQIQVDWDAIFEARSKNEITMRFVRSLIEHYGRGTEAANYTLCKYANIGLYSQKGGKRYIQDPQTKRFMAENKEDIVFVCRAYAEFLTKELTQNPGIPNDIHLLLEGFKQTQDPGITEDIKRIQKQVLQYVSQGRITFDPPPHDPDRCSLCRQGYADSCKSTRAYKQRKKIGFFLDLYPGNQASEVDPVLRPIIEKEWEKGPLEGYIWFAYCNWQKLRAIKDLAASAYSPYIKRLHELYDDKPKTAEIVRLYMQFAIIFYRTEQYDLSRPLLEQIVQSKDENGMPFDVGMRAMSLYLMALLKVRDKNYPEALVLAKEGLKIIGNQPDNACFFWEIINIDGTGTGFGSGAKPMTVNLINNLRTNTAPEFINPYEKRNKEVYYW